MSSFRTIKQHLEDRLQSAVASLWRAAGIEGDPAPSSLQPTKQASFGDYATTAALGLAKALRPPPRAVAEKLQAALGDAGGLLAKIEIAGPGYLNFFVRDEALRASLYELLAAGPGFIRSDAGAGKKVLVEYVSANPTGPLHIAHGRGAVMGDVLCNLLDAAGYHVEREFYVNDLGNQCDVMARSVHLRYQELCGRAITTPEEFYPGEYIIDIAKELLAEHKEAYLDAPEEAWLPVFRACGIARMLDRIRDDLERFGVRFDRFVSERELTSRLGFDGLLQGLAAEGHVYEQEGKRWFRTTDFGDDKDRVVVREDGRPTYFASDILYHDDKLRRGFASLIDIWGADHGGYIARVKAGIAALGWPPEALEVLLVQMVSLSRGGESVRMGKRLGTAVWLREVIDEAGRDATRYFFLMRRMDAQLDFDIDLAKKRSLDNPVYYAQMGHARLCAIARRARQEGVFEPELAEGALDALVLPAEIGLIKTLLLAPEVVRDAAESREPHRVVHYVQELIAQFHAYYTQYKGSERVVSEDAVKTRARLLLCRALQMALAALLGILGVEAPEQMSLVEES